jgi:AraC-like DNA-binding protein
VLKENKLEYPVLAQNIHRWIDGREDCDTAIPDLTFFRRNTPTEPHTCLVPPSIVIAVQGKKQLFVGGVPHLYDSSKFLITSLDLPAQSQVLEASPSRPCLGLALKLDLRVMAELITQYGLSFSSDKSGGMGVAVGTLSENIMNPIERLVELLDEPASIPVLAPLIQKEIHYRLLMSDQAARLWHIIAMGSQSQRIGNAINWLKQNYSSPLRVENLAEKAQMSSSTFHQRFRELTSMSPLQYQKWLRLNEARRLMLNDDYDAATASFEVGYESPSQFNREYSRMFGAPPKRDIENMRRAVAEN